MKYKYIFFALILYIYLVFIIEAYRYTHHDKRIKSSKV